MPKPETDSKVEDRRANEGRQHDRRSGIDTRTEEEKRLMGERRSGQDRRKTPRTE